MEIAGRLKQAALLGNLASPTDSALPECIPNLEQAVVFPLSDTKRASPAERPEVERQQGVVVLFDFQRGRGQGGWIEQDCRTEAGVVKEGIVFHQDNLELVVGIDAQGAGLVRAGAHLNPAKEPAPLALQLPHPSQHRSVGCRDGLSGQEQPELSILVAGALGWLHVAQPCQ